MKLKSLEDRIDYLEVDVRNLNHRLNEIAPSKSLGASANARLNSFEERLGVLEKCKKKMEEGGM